MELKKKLITSVIISAVVLVSATAGAFAASNLQAIKANLNLGIKFKVDGKDWTPKDQKGNTQYAITYNGSTYVPLRAAGSALGVEVGWDGANNTVWLGEGAAAVEKGNGSATTPTTSLAGLSRSNPAAIGQVVSYGIDNFMDKYTAEITIAEVIRGEEAWKMIETANRFNSPAPEGHEYILAKINFKVASNKNADAKVDLSPIDFKLVSKDGKDYEHRSVVEPDPGIRTSLYTGASHTGWAAFIVKTDDNSPLLTFGREYDGTKGAWFKVQ